jgi:phosphate transport system permease protein
VRTIFRIVLPAALPGITTGIILAVGRIIGETAALMYTAGTVTHVATSLLSSGRTLAFHMFNLASEGLYTKQAYATAVVLLLIVILINWVSGRIAKILSKV